MTIIVGGCSFTHADNSWARWIPSVRNLGVGGVGNSYITSQLLRNLSSGDICIVQYSSFWRKELMIPENHRFRSVVDNSLPSWDAGEELWGLSSQKIRILRTTDPEAEWWRSTPLHKFMNTWETWYSSEQRIIESLESICKLQWYCKLNDIQLFQFFGWEECIFHSDYVELIKPTWDLIDWDSIWFWDGWGGMAEWCVDHGYTGDLSEDCINTPPQGVHRVSGRLRMIGHPSSESHYQFCSSVILPWLNSVCNEDIRLSNDHVVDR